MQLTAEKFYRKQEYDKNNPLHRWLKFFDWNMEEDALKELIQMDEAIAAADEKAKKVAASEKELRYYEAMEDARRNRISSMRYHEEKGYKKGEAKGRAEGEKRLAALMDRLLQDNRMDDMQRVIKQPELRDKYFQEYEL